MDLLEQYPDIKEARAYAKHNKHTQALEIYVEILEDVEKDSEEYVYLLLEYSQCLIEYIMHQSELSIFKLLHGKQSYNDQEIEEDLETCWDSLEVCRISFTKLYNRQKLCEVYKGLGDVLCLQNKFEEGKKEYLSAVNYCDDDLIIVELMDCLADCCKHTKDYESAISYYDNIIRIYSGNKDLQDEYKELKESMIRQLLNSKEAQKDKNQHESVASDGVVKNINHLKR